MKKQEVKNIENVINEVSNAQTTKGAKQKAKVNSVSVAPTRKETKTRFMSFICSREEISINKFFKLLNAFKAEDINGYNEYLSARKMDSSLDYSFEWFKDNCPKMEGNFAKWVKVNGKNPKNENEDYNRVTENGIEYTLKPYNCFRANWEQYEQILNDVVKDLARIARERKAKAKAEQNEKKQAEKKATEIEKLKARLAELENA